MATDHLVNPSSSAIRDMAFRDSEGQLLRREEANDLRALLTNDGDLYVWRSWDAQHWGFASEHGLSDKTHAWLYIDAVRNKVRASSFSHAGNDLHALAEQLRKHPRLQLFDIEG